MSTLTQFLAVMATTTGAVVDISGIPSPISHTVDEPAGATAQVVFTAGGAVTYTGGTAPNWIDPLSAAGGDYEVRATVTAGPALGSSPGTGWYALSSNRTYAQTNGVPGTTVGSTVTFEIRRTSSGIVVAAKTGVTLSATVIPSGPPD